MNAIPKANINVPKVELKKDPQTSPLLEVHGNSYSLQKKMLIFNDFQHGFAPCISTGWDSRDRKHHYIKKQRPKRESLIPGQKNAVNSSSILKRFIYLRSTSNLHS
jgi:hypothetical protein